jgi:hypothetical protein
MKIVFSKYFVGYMSHCVWIWRFLVCFSFVHVPSTHHDLPSSSPSFFCSLYPSCHWDDKAIRRLVGDGRLAARLKGNDTRKSVTDKECPICFMHYSQVNVTQCCKANICTECFLQVRPQREKHSVCPFCNHPKMFVAIAKRLDAGEIQDRETKEQEQIEASIRARAQGEELPPMQSANANGFGSSLDENDIVRRARSRTMSSGNEGDAAAAAGGACRLNCGPIDDIQLLRQLSLSSQDRTALEQEMRAQHTHPLALQMDAEAEERRMNNELEYYRNNPQRNQDAALVRARMMSAQNADALNGSLRNRFTRMNSTGGRSSRRWGGDFPGDVNSLDDMVVLEAALMLSMEEDARRNSGAPAPSQVPGAMTGMQQFLGGDSTGGGSRRRFRGPLLTASSMSSLMESPSTRGLLSEDEQVAMAIALSMQEQQESDKKEEEEADGDSKPEARGGEKTPPESAPSTSAPSSAGVASLPIVSEDDCDDDMEEEIIFSQPSAEPKGKSSLDDSAYFRSLEAENNTENDTKFPERTITNFQEEIIDMPLATTEARIGSDEDATD